MQWKHYLKFVFAFIIIFFYLKISPMIGKLIVIKRVFFLDWKKISLWTSKIGIDRQRIVVLPILNLFRFDIWRSCESIRKNAFLWKKLENHYYRVFIRWAISGGNVPNELTEIVLVRLKKKKKRNCRNK